MSKTGELTGTVEDVFGHRFTLATDQGKKLIDLGPGGEHEMTLTAGQEISVRGEDKPGEVKAREIRLDEGEWQPVKGGDGPAPKPADGQTPKPDLEDEHVTRLLDEAGYTDHGARERKPKHVEVMASKDGQRHKVHVHRDGVKKAEPVG